MNKINVESIGAVLKWQDKNAPGRHPQDTHGNWAVGGSRKEPWQMTRAEYAVPPAPPKRGPNAGGYNEPIKSQMQWIEGKVSNRPGKIIEPKDCARCGQQLKKWSTNGREYLGLDCYFVLVESGDLARSGESVVGKRPSHKSIVKRAIAEGKPVPPEVLAEYPGLAL
jgi:hypothetical protein